MKYSTENIDEGGFNVEVEKKVNEKYKDSIFTTLFSDKEKVLELYNAVERKSYPATTEIEINTLDGVLYRDRMNDVSFIIEDRLIVLVEQQSTLNENMPLRFLLYICKLYEQIIVHNKSNIYRTKLTKIPKPEFICLYNGKDDFPDEKILKLSDAFRDVDGMDKTDLELSVRVLNINKGKNTEIVENSKVLSDYVTFIDKARNYVSDGIALSDAINKTVKFCIENGILVDFLQKYRAEVMSMLSTEFDSDTAFEAARLDGIEIGLEQGLEQGESNKAMKVAKGMLEHNMDINLIVELTGLTEREVEQLQNN